MKELDLLIEISNTTGNGSQKIIKDLLSNNMTDDMQYLLDIAQNPFKTTKLNKIEIPDGVDLFSTKSTFKDWCSLIEELLEAKSANNSYRERMSSIIKGMGLNKDQEDMLVKITTKNLNIGLGTKLINKAVGYNMIPDPSLMLAEAKEDEIEKWDRIWCEEKYDGVRVCALVKDEDVTFFTRAFKELDNTKLSKIKGQLLEYCKDSDPVFFDGELTDLDRRSVSGKVNKIMKGTAPDNIDDEFLFNIFDMDDWSTLVSGKGVKMYTDRRSRLEKFFKGVPQDSCLVLANQ